MNCRRRVTLVIIKLIFAPEAIFVYVSVNEATENFPRSLNFSLSKGEGMEKKRMTTNDDDDGKTF